MANFHHFDNNLFHGIHQSFGQRISGVGGKGADVEWMVAKTETKAKVTRVYRGYDVHMYL